MKSFVHFARPLLLVAVHLFLFGTLCAQGVETMDAETGDWSQWRAKVSGTEDHEIVSDPVCGGNYAYKWTQSDGRTESAGEYQPKDTDLWYGFSIYLGPGFTTDISGSTCSKGASVAQIHGYHKSCPKSDRSIAMLRIDDGQYKWWLKKMNGVTGCYDKLAPAKIGEWQQVVVNTKLTSSGEGYFRCWIDGELVLEKYGTSWSSCPQGAYFKMGTYAFAKTGDWMLGDEIRIGRSRSQVDPANFCGGGSTPPSPPPANECRTNLALGATVSSSAAQSGNGAARAIDGIANTNDNRWSAQGFPQSLTLDLGRRKRVTGVEIVPSFGRGYRYKVDIKEKGSDEYRTVVDRRNSNIGNSTLLQADIDPSLARYVRVTFTGCSGSNCSSYNWVSAREVRVLGCNPTNTARSATTPEKHVKRVGSDEKLSLYPNPSQTGLFKVVGQGAGSITVYSTSGKALWWGIIRTGESLDLSSYPSGIYLARTWDGQQFRLVKE